MLPTWRYRRGAGMSARAEGESALPPECGVRGSAPHRSQLKTPAGTPLPWIRPARTQLNRAVEGDQGKKRNPLNRHAKTGTMLARARARGRRAGRGRRKRSARCELGLARNRELRQLHRPGWISWAHLTRRSSFSTDSQLQAHPHHSVLMTRARLPVRAARMPGRPQRPQRLGGSRLCLAPRLPCVARRGQQLFLLCRERRAVLSLSRGVERRGRFQALADQLSSPPGRICGRLHGCARV